MVLTIVERYVIQKPMRYDVLVTSRCLLLVLLPLLAMACSSSNRGSEDGGDSGWNNAPVVKSIFGDFEKTEPIYFFDQANFERDKKRGEYLISIAGCGDCHSSYDASRAESRSFKRGVLVSDLQGGLTKSADLSGGRVVRDEFGQVVVPNITPDIETGVGKWNASEIMRAVRSSIRRDGKPMGIRVHEGYAWMGDVDLRAISIALMSREPITNTVPHRELGALQRNSWALFPKHSDIPGYVPAMVASRQPSYGRYLYHNVGRCVLCHTENPTVAEANPSIKSTFGVFTGALGALAGMVVGGGGEGSDLGLASGPLVQFSRGPDLLRRAEDDAPQGVDDDRKVYAWSDEKFIDYLGKGVEDAQSPANDKKSAGCGAIGRGFSNDDAMALISYIRDSVRRHDLE